MAKIKAKKTVDMKDADTSSKKVKKIKKERYVSETEEEVRRLIIILIVITLFVVGMYFVSKRIVDKRNTNTNTTQDTEASISYDVISVGTLLNRPYTEYYVLAYDSEDEDAMYYSSLLSNYKSKKEKEKIYFLDLGNALNKSYKSDSITGNASAKSIEDLSFGNITLLKIKKGAIVSYIEDLSKIESELK